ncbi:Ran-binding protein 3 [Danaus plexippus plexippus]|uniref:Ran-binding protein 3 n=1 Tax=Danaus plexippus plexippus TaxID=278856 RepID=A0A212F0P3_DANPL|nr:Ran-binding protein 3 [Danaus plexippus plexippus]
MADAKQSKTEEIYNGSSQSRVVLAKPRLGGFGSSNLLNSSSSKSCNPFGSVLRPPQLKPGNNPFLKVSETKPSVDKDKNSNEETGENRQQESKEEEAPKFVPLGSSSSASRSATTMPAPSQATSSSGFVFGQNLSERVVIKESLNNGEASVDHSSSNGTSELLFTSAAASVKENNQTQEEGGLYESGEGLAAAAAEYERSHARPPPPANYCTMTGEEDEINVMQISCRLFAWESGSWRERGRGVLRLNDGAGGSGARLVARVAGSLRVVLNTKLWPDMVVDRAANKSLRITAADAQQQVKLFLIMGTPGDIAQLHKALLSRISLSKRSYNSKEDENSQRSAERLEAATDDNDYTEKSVDDSNQEDEGSNFDEEQDIDIQRDQESENRLESSKEKSDEKSDIRDLTEEKESKPLKRKEPVEEETSPKRQCSENH